MDGINLHLPPVIPDSYYDISTHNTGYHTYQNAPNTGWPNREDNSRVYQSPNTDFDSQLRFHGNSSVRRGCQLDSGDGVNSVNDDAHSTTPVEQDWAEEDDKDVGDTLNEKTSPRQSQVALTLQWLNENYERAEGVCLPRCVLYQHYLDFCKKMKFTPAGAATFGKIIRQRFPKLTTRRLGTRGQSKYHYYGIGIKETSIYYHSVYSGKGLTRFSGIKLKTEGSSRKYSLSSKTGTLLPEFPNAKNFILPPGTDIEKMRTFIMMYRTHCQRILDTIISANFEEVQNFLVHFWQGMPEHLLDLLNCDILSDIIALCDSILYKVLVDVLIPSSIQELPKSLYGEMRMFAKRLPFWLETSMETVPSHIQEKKLQVAKSFIQSLKRQSSFVHLAQTARSVVTNQDMVAQMIKDISNVDFVDICSQAGFLDPSSNPKFCMKMQNFYNEFSDLLAKQSPIEGYTEWIDDIVDKCAIKPSNDDTELFKDNAAEFLLHWGAFGGLLMRELTLQNASSFASIHLVHLMLDEYAFLVIETQQEAETEKTLQKAVQKHMKTAEEIQTKAVVRNSSNKGMQSPKCKKKRTIDEVEQGETQMHNGDIRIGSTDMNSMVTESVHNGTAFSRPLPNNKESHLPENIDHESHRSQNNALSINSVKPYQPYNNSFDRPTYLPQFGLSPYPEYAPFSNSRLTNYSDSYTQSFPSPHLGSNISPVGSNYWTDGRTHHTFSDPYPSYNYNYNKLNATYDSLNKTTLLRNNAYQESISRQAFESPISGRSYYRGAHDNLQVGPQLQVGAYGTNFMDIAPPGGQYCYQDELFPATMATTFGKPFLSGPFR